MTTFTGHTMPRIVERVPNPWEPYQDGNIWEFTEDEWRTMPSARPVMNEIGEIVGMTCITWYMKNESGEYHHYIRFLTREQREFLTVEQMANYKSG